MQDAVLLERIRSVHAESDATYGMPRVRAELRDQGIAVSRKHVARLMRRAGIRGVSRRRAFIVTTRRDGKQRPAPDLVKREFKADGANQLWVADMTYVPTWAGFIFLAVVLDVWSRRVVGWAIGEEMTAELVLAALNMALQQRRPEAVIHHSDQGSQGRFNRSLQHLKKEVFNGTIQGMGSRTDRESAHALAGPPPNQSTACQAGILAMHCTGLTERGCGTSLWCFSAVRAALVPRSWRHATNELSASVGAVHIILRA